jgi:tetratricopeptide (TPR) repeat protein
MVKIFRISLFYLIFGTFPLLGAPSLIYADNSDDEPAAAAATPIRKESSAHIDLRNSIDTKSDTTVSFRTELGRTFLADSSDIRSVQEAIKLEDQRKFQELLSLYPQIEFIRSNSQPDESLTSFEQLSIASKRLDTELSLLQYKRGLRLYESGQKVEAYGLFLKASQLGVKPALLFLARICLDLEDYRRSIQYLHQAIEVPDLKINALMLFLTLWKKRGLKEEKPEDRFVYEEQAFKSASELAQLCPYGNAVLGCMLLLQEGCKKDMGTDRKAYGHLKAAATTEVIAQFWLAYSYESIISQMPASFSYALRYYNEAAENHLKSDFPLNLLPEVIAEQRKYRDLANEKVRELRSASQAQPHKS